MLKSEGYFLLVTAHVVLLGLIRIFDKELLFVTK